MKFHVEPASGDVKVPAHPIEGPMPAEGAQWIADQYTLRLILDGVIRRVPEGSDASAEPPKAAEPEKAAEPASTAPEPVINPAPDSDDHYAAPVGDHEEH